MNNDVQPAISTNQSVSNQDHIEQFKSLYYLLKGKRDTDIKLFNEYKQFRYDDIIELNDKIYRKLRLHQLVTDTNSVVVALSNKEIKSFGSWNEFLRYDWITSATTEYITLEWDFNLILPNQTHDVPQTHTLRVRIGSGLRPSEMIQVIFQGVDEVEFEEAQAQVVCRIDFVNSQICSELKTIVTEWYNALSNNSEDHKIIKFLFKNKSKIQYAIVVMFLIACVIVLNFITHYYLSHTSKTETNDLLYRFYLLASCSFIAIYVAFVTGKLYSNKVIEMRVSNFSRNPMFEFTRGDGNKFDEITKRNKKLLSKFVWDIVIALSVNVIALLIGKLFPEFLNFLK